MESQSQRLSLVWYLKKALYSKTLAHLCSFALFGLVQWSECRGCILDLQCYSSATRTECNIAKCHVKATVTFDQYGFVRVRKDLKHTIPIQFLLCEFPEIRNLYLVSFIMENFSLLLLSQIYTVSERYSCGHRRKQPHPPSCSSHISFRNTS